VSKEGKYLEKLINEAMDLDESPETVALIATALSVARKLVEEKTDTLKESEAYKFYYELAKWRA